MSATSSAASSVKGDDDAPEAANTVEKKVDEVLDAFSNALRDAVKRIIDGDTKTKDPVDNRHANERALLLPEVREVTFENFKNSFHQDPKTPAVEALVVGNTLVYDVRRDLLKRTRAAAREKKGPQATTSTASEVPQQILPEDGWVQRIRIRSASVLGYLAREAGQTWASEDPFTFVKPFRVPIYFQPGMRKALEKLEQRWHGLEEAEAERLSTTASPAPESVKDDHDEATEKQPEKLRSGGGKVSGEGIKPLARTRTGRDGADSMLNSLAALRDMREYVKFVDDRIMPLASKFDGTSRDKIKFEELWLLFKPGEILHSPPRDEIKKEHRRYEQPTEHHIRSYQELYRTYGVTSPADETSFLTTISRKDKNDRDREYYGWPGEKRLPKFEITAYYIDYDGNSYAPAMTTFDIEQYEGEKRINSLPCYPIRFAPNKDTLLEEHTRQGRIVEKFYGETHLAYSGWSMGHNPDGKQVKGSDDHWARPLIPQYIDGTVIVDVDETFNTHPQYKPDFRLPQTASESWELTADDVAFHWYTSYDRGKLDAETPDVVMTRDGVGMRQQREALDKDEFLEAFIFGWSAQRYKPRERPLPDDLLMFLPKRLFAYVLRDREHVMVDVNDMSIIVPPTGVFEALKIPASRKAMIRGLVRTHFDKKQLKAKLAARNEESKDQDLIRGKGNGLVILLHGAPGVGKTATAEAVAIETKRPLFTISCGDVGTVAEVLEQRLDDIFRLANKWDCVLLFDEADVFLSQRSKLDVKRNALVSCFLRALEYYSGILFLTTNRVGTFDEAFTSRIHLSLHYPQLNEEQTERIFEANINRLVEIDAQRADVNQAPPLRIERESILQFGREQFLRGANSAASSSSNPNNPNAGRRRPGLSPNPGGSTQASTSANSGSVAWNGRQIRNAFQIAASLAYHRHARLVAQDPSTAPPQPVLDASDFQKVAETTQAFNVYLTQTRGYTDAELAGVGGIRADAYEIQVLLESQRQRRQHQQQQQHGGDSYSRQMHATADYGGGMGGMGGMAGPSGMAGSSGMAGMGGGEGMADHRRFPSAASSAYGHGGLGGDGYAGQGYQQAGYDAQTYHSGPGADASYAMRPARPQVPMQAGPVERLEESYD